MIASFVSPYQSTRDFARQLIKDFVEVYVYCPLHICAQRDPKGLYRKANQGEILDLTGPQDPYEEPPTPELTVHTEIETPDASAGMVIEKLMELGYLDRLDGAA